jgi:histidine phosphotransfer protein HptB
MLTKCYHFRQMLGLGLIWGCFLAEGEMIDWARVDELRSEIGQDDFMEVVDMFLEEADGVIVQLTAPPDLSQVESQLHFLKGSALNLGLTDLAALCQDGERLATIGGAAAVNLQQVADVYSASRKLFLDTLNRSAAA